MSFISTYLVIVFYIALLIWGIIKVLCVTFASENYLSSSPPAPPQKEQTNKKILNTLPFYHISIENNAESVYNKM